MSHHYSKSSTSAYQQRVDVPIQRVSNNIDSRHGSSYRTDIMSSRDTTAQWIHDSTTDREKFRIKINIEGFHRNDIHSRVEGNKLCIYGERIENKSQGTSKKIIEKSYNLPSDVDKSNPYVTYPTSSIMQVDFSAKYSSRKKSVNTRDYSPNIERSHENRIDTLPIQRVSINSRNSTNTTPVLSNDQIYKFHSSIANSKVNKTVPVYKQINNNTHRRRPTPTVGLQSTNHGDVQRSSSPALSNIIEEESTRSSSSSSSSSSDTDDTHSNLPTSYFPQEFNSENFYQSVFQPEIFVDDRRQRYIEMRLDVQDYKPDEIKVSINDNDLTVQIENTNFYKQITLPSNADLSTLSTHYHHDKKLYITVRLLDAHSSFRYI